MREHGQKPFVNLKVRLQISAVSRNHINTGFHNFNPVDILGQIILFGGKMAVLCITVF